MKGNITIADLGQITEETVKSWYHKYKKTEKGFRCKKCRSRILQTTCYVSIHLKEFDPYHAGSGKVLEINYPYCPKCDGKIDYATACYHVSLIERRVIMIDKVLL